MLIKQELRIAEIKTSSIWGFYLTLENRKKIDNIFKSCEAHIVNKHRCFQYYYQTNVLFSALST